MPRARRAKRAGSAPAKRPLLALAFAGVLLGFALTAEERTFGTISDEEQMLRTAVAMAEFGEVGIARGAFFTIHRPQGDAGSPYGIGLSLAQVPVAKLANGWERRNGAGSSQTLFVGLQLLLVAAASLGAALLARALGAGETGTLVALLGTAFASPLWGYVSTGYSEPLQAAALVFTLLCALRGGQPGAKPGWAVAAGALAGAAVLAKSLNVVLVPLLLAPLLPAREGRLGRLVRAGAAFVPFVAAFVAFEIARIGRPFAAYGGQPFSHPPLDGLWRLLVGVNKGILWYFPLLVVARAGLLAVARRSRTAAVAIGGSLAALVALASAWWAWDGTVGWGPRLLVPVIPLLAAAAGVGAAGRWTRPAWALLAVGAALNALGVFQPQSATAAYISSLPPVTLTKEEARLYSSEFFERLPDGGARIDREHVAGSDAALSPFRVHAFLLEARLAASSSEELERRLANPPWAKSRPDLVPRPQQAVAAASSLVAFNRTPFSWPHLFSASPRPRDARADAFAAAWDAALADQLLRALDIGKPERALALGERLLEITPSGYTAALYAEALRAARRPETLAAFLRTLPPEFRSSPSLGVVEALAARDAGDEAAARRTLEAVAKVFPRPALVAALSQPMASWPAGLHAMTGDNRAGSRVDLPGVGPR